MPCDPIRFPILFRYGDKVIAAGEDFIHHWNIRHLRENRFTCPESVQVTPRFHWIIDAEGQFRKCREIAIHRSWLRPLRHIWTGVRIEIEILPGASLRVRDFSVHLKGGKVQARSFRKFLGTLTPDEELTRELFLTYMNEPQIGQEVTFPRR